MDIKSSVYSELNHTYEPIPDSIPDFEDDPATAESNSISGHIQDTQITKKQKWKNPIAILIIIQMLILIVLASSHIVLNYSQMVRCPDGPKPPYSPLYEDNAVQYINQKMHPQRIFQSESSTIVDAAWEEPLEEYDRAVLMPTSLSKEGNLPESIEAWLDPGYAVYAVSVYHQLHCLNRIRKTFYPEKFFLNESEEDIIYHKNHCFDLLRQVILCHADASLVYWWNSNWTTVADDGSKQYTEEYLSLTPKERYASAFVKWDVPNRCHDMSSINDWIQKHKMNESKYAAIRNQLP